MLVRSEEADSRTWFTNTNLSLNPKNSLKFSGKSWNEKIDVFYTRQYFCLQNPMERGAWRAIVHSVTKSRTPLKQLSMHTHFCNTIPGMVMAVM